MVAVVRPAGAVVGAAAGAVVGAAAGAAVVVVGTDCAGTTPTGASAAAAVREPVGAAMDTETSPAGGQGSPPGTRGRPRRSCQAAVAPVFASESEADIAAGVTVSRAAAGTGADAAAADVS
ncbi:hypothetical protein [Paenarthrobacter sp. Z7-10]|uniref:hypothetical protein n=1 Tax=Paenarthrobacter sp. Z7-10 TaxID=2787635 RepID=UPI0022A92FEF|nr:hypothetical protein [Paenarthrobacter sp. Z7-10]